MRPYEISVDEANHVVRAKLQGFWDIATTHAYIADLAVAARRVARNGAQSWWLIDSSDSTTQSGEVAALMGERLADVIPADVFLAVVSGSALQTMQAKRVIANDTHRYFATVAAAEAWLAEQPRAL